MQRWIFRGFDSCVVYCSIDRLVFSYLIWKNNFQSIFFIVPTFVSLRRNAIYALSALTLSVRGNRVTVERNIFKFPMNRYQRERRIQHLHAERDQSIIKSWSETFLPLPLIHGSSSDSRKKIIARNRLGPRESSRSQASLFTDFTPQHLCQSTTPTGHWFIDYILAGTLNHRSKIW